MESTELRKINNPDVAESHEAAENDPCLPVNTGNSARKSMESLNRNRDLEEGAGGNSSVLESEKNKANSHKNNYQVKQTNTKKTRIPTIKFTPPPTSEFEKWCSDKTGLSRSGLLLFGGLLLLLIIFLFVIIIMSCLWPTTPHSYLFPICRSAACLMASSEVITKMNQSIDPCDDIRKYSCGHWLSTHSIPLDKYEWGVKQQMQYKHREKIRDMITTMPYPDELEKISWKVKNIYDSCMSLGTIETEGSSPLRKVVSTQLGGWRVLRQFSLQTWDMKRTLKLLHSKYNVQPFFQVDVVPDPMQPLQSIIQLSPGSLVLPDKSYYFRRSDDKVVVAYKRFMKDVAVTLAATTSDASSFSEDLFGFERRLAERFPSRLPERPGQLRPTIAKLEEIAPTVPFFDILSAMFPNAKLTTKSEVIVLASDHLVNVSRIISSTDRSVLNDYMMWRLAVGYLPYLSKTFRDILHEFHSHLYGNREPMARWEFCVETLQKFVGFGVEALLESSHVDHDRKRKVVEDMFNEIRSSTKRAVQESNNLPAHVQEHFLDKMNTIGVQVGLPVSMRHSSYYDDFYNSLTSIKDDFYQNIFYCVSFHLEEQQRRLTSPSEEHRWMDIVSNGELKVVYVPEINKVIVPLALLSMPHFHTHYPASVLYGSLGSEIGRGIVSSVIGKGLFHAGDGTLLASDHPLSNLTHDCFLHHPSATPVLEANKYTFKALENVLRYIPHTHQPALEYLEDQAIFFITYAQSICTLKTNEKSDIDATLKSYLDDSATLQIIMSKSKQFSSAFSCQHPLEKDTCDSLI